MTAKVRRIRDVLFEPLIWEPILLVVLLLGSHVFIVDVRSYVSEGVAIPVATGLVAGIAMRCVVDDERISREAAAVAVLSAFVLGIAGSWAVSVALVGSAGESARIPGFALAILSGSILERIRNEAMAGSDR